MANEGSTKPTYSELETELLRVRGLLQRQYVLADESVWRNAFFSALAYSGPSPKDGAHRRGDKIFRRMMELQWEIEHGPLDDPGAESADIGKQTELEKAIQRWANAKREQVLREDTRGELIAEVRAQERDVEDAIYEQLDAEYGVADIGKLDTADKSDGEKA